ncbi:UDP-N-acetylmuramoyl-tripeptide--D-alanyl-D-alanine ligase [Methylomonas paludis]|uniref:UDP-N-acetylmuramoyl-tripeptide--D-alanyl-D-alanine ligase n=1 Tax=Methylomonas paludis TaxID=1173101 RepID=A0A975RAA4_9GAMM|nr:UDP-N-acetylmuramoyl-tripeptide--D-alanyl-D-alanine ligase [Methylomonas paludis]QWF71031.1 UDP-N-acetylmuramoyl-tripeptide--D-alanyl-D-alanine ligase [Methylomonas paludis]
MNLALNDIATAVSGQLLGANFSVAGVSIDTRSLQPGQLYIALSGQNFDGHAFIEQAEQAGAAAVLVEHQGATHLPQIIVNDSRRALAELAGYWRNSLSLKLAGVTGSNGKTTVKEMIAAILGTQGETLYTQGNLNNEIGVPLTLLRLTEKHRFAVIEMGANHLGEIAYTSHYAQADVSVITNVGPAHIEGFGSVQGVARAKAEIIENLPQHGVAVLNRDDEYFEFWLDLAGNRKICSFGLHEQADIRARNIETALTSQGFQTSFELQAGSDTVSINLHLAGEHNVRNALAAAAVARQFQVSLADIKSGLESLRPVTGRMQPLIGRKGNIIIDDTYNANPASLKAALAALDSGAQNWLILGAFAELGEDSAHIHQQMGEMIKTMSVQRLFAVGEATKQTVAAFGKGARFFETQAQLIAAVNQEIKGKEILLVKGSRSQKMENVVASMVDNFRAA